MTIDKIEEIIELIPKGIVYSRYLEYLLNPKIDNSIDFLDSEFNYEEMIQVY